MKNIIIAIVLVALLLLGCEKTSNPVGASENPADEPSYPEKVLLSGQVVEVYIDRYGNEKTLPVANAVISALDSTYITERGGQFQLVCPKGDSLRLQITKPFYLPFEQTVFFEADTKLIFELEPIRADFFPLAVGNYWNYDFYFQANDRGANSNENWYGTQSWQIMNSFQDSENTNYRILTILNAVKYYRRSDWDGTVVENDTTFAQNDSSYFVIAENQFHWLNFKYQQAFRLFEPIDPFERYQPLYNSDTLVVRRETSLVRDKGFVNLWCQISGQNPTYLKLKLLDFQIVPEE